jgi:beta-xylosidase
MNLDCSACLHFSSMLAIFSLLLSLALLSHTLYAAPTKRVATLDPKISLDFADPAVINVDGQWYAFATTNDRYNVQVAQSSDFDSWTVLEKDPLPLLPPWAQGPIWAPDVVQRVCCPWLPTLFPIFSIDTNCLRTMGAL